MIEIVGITKTTTGLKLAIKFKFNSRNINGTPDQLTDGYRVSQSFAQAFHQAVGAHAMYRERFSQKAEAGSWYDCYDIVIIGDDPAIFTDILTETKRLFKEIELKKATVFILPEETDQLRKRFEGAL